MKNISTFKNLAGISPEALKTSKNANDYWLLFDTPETMVPIGENSASISGVDLTGEYFQLNVDGYTDAVKIEVFSGEVIRQVRKRVKELIG